MDPNPPITINELAQLLGANQIQIYLLNKKIEALEARLAAWTASPVKE